ncbi:helix-turn-helix transcriptional regulator [Kutzneria sp. CA-103260]|uniref:helix-turn-helix transcriptional regulator n=1 Tax=Kutzneria sp. CA-103260 TaxID=2802641 RepID=UPI001BAA2631|nr:helix-turn-helix transcriptional regulator [Kutzneria sp. CA-103260]QUQ68694.1 DNA-binding protein [Kutzneria sp. CA-103260]
MAASELSAYLQACRARVRPEDVGLAPGLRRRVSGLRREEVAQLADVSVDYYTRLEQGRERHPSLQVLEALTRALALRGDARDHLYRLAGLLPGPPAEATSVSPDLLRMMDAWPDTPAYILNRTYDFLALNRMAEALYSDFADTGNLVRMVILDPVGRTFFVDWERALHACVANLRLAAGHDPRDPRLRELVAELTEHSPEFTALWRQHQVRGKTSDAKTLRHSKIGELTLSYQAFDVRGTPGQQLLVHQAEGAASTEKLTLLGSLAANIPEHL